MSTFSIICIGVAVAIALIVLATNIFDRLRDRDDVAKEIARLEVMKTKWCIYTSDVDAYFIRAYYTSVTGNTMYLGYKIDPYALFSRRTDTSVGFSQDSSLVDQDIPLHILMRSLDMCISSGFIKSK